LVRRRLRKSRKKKREISKKSILLTISIICGILYIINAFKNQDIFTIPRLSLVQLSLGGGEIAGITIAIILVVVVMVFLWIKWRRMKVRLRSGVVKGLVNSVLGGEEEQVVRKRGLRGLFTKRSE